MATIQLNSSRRELGIWLELFVTVVAVVLYANAAIASDFNFAQMARTITKIIALSVGFTILGTVIINLLIRDPDIKDERDNLFELKAVKSGYVSLTIMIALLVYEFSLIVWTTPDGVSIFDAMPSLVLQHLENPTSPINVIHLLFLALVVGSVVKLATALFYYRRGY